MKKAQPKKLFINNVRSFEPVVNTTRNICVPQRLQDHGKQKTDSRRHGLGDIHIQYGTSTDDRLIESYSSSKLIQCPVVTKDLSAIKKEIVSPNFSGNFFNLDASLYLAKGKKLSNSSRAREDTNLNSSTLQICLDSEKSAIGSTKLPDLSANQDEIVNISGRPTNSRKKKNRVKKKECRYKVIEEGSKVEDKQYPISKWVKLKTPELNKILRESSIPPDEQKRIRKKIRDCKNSGYAKKNSRKLEDEYEQTRKKAEILVIEETELLEYNRVLSTKIVELKIQIKQRMIELDVSFEGDDDDECTRIVLSTMETGTTKTPKKPKGQMMKRYYGQKRSDILNRIEEIKQEAEKMEDVEFLDQMLKPIESKIMGKKMEHDTFEEPLG